jgi:polysaccharide export outer membrane protein
MITGSGSKRGATAAFAAGLILLLSSFGCGPKGSYLFEENQDGEVQRGVLDLEQVPRTPVAEEYLIGYGDALDIQFLYNREFTKLDILVRPDGKISFPYVGEITVAGKTAGYLDSLLTARYAEIIKDPDITVMLRSFDAKYVYVLGQVNKPGAYSFEIGGTLLRALSMASGLTKKGKRNSVLVIRRVAPDRIVGMQIDVQDLLEGQNFALDIPLQPYDIVYVPKNWISRTEDYAEQLYNILVMPMDLYLKGWQVKGIKVYYDFYERANRPIVTP